MSWSTRVCATCDGYTEHERVELPHPPYVRYDCANDSPERELTVRDVLRSTIVEYIQRRAELSDEQLANAIETLAADQKGDDLIAALLDVAEAVRDGSALGNALDTRAGFGMLGEHPQLKRRKLRRLDERELQAIWAALDFALRFGDLNDPKNEGRKAAAESAMSWVRSALHRS